MMLACDMFIMFVAGPNINKARLDGMGETLMVGGHATSMSSHVIYVQDEVTTEPH